MTLSNKARIALKRAMFTNPNMAAEICDAIDGRVRDQECRGATTANIVLASTGLTAIDGITPVAGQHWLVKNQDTAAQNGVYVASADAWTRVKDGASVAITLIAGMTVNVAEGTLNGSTEWILGSDLTTWTEVAASSATPTALGVAATAGTSNLFAKGDHVHAWAQKKTVTVGHADLTSAVDNAAQSIAIGTALPANAIVLAVVMTLTTQFTGGGASALVVDVGWSGALESLIKDFDAFGSTASGAKYNKGAAAATLLVNGPTTADAKALLATFTPDASTNGVDFTAGAMTFDVYYVVGF